MGRLRARVPKVLLVCCAVVMAGAPGGRAVYTVGNLEGISPGVEGILVLEASNITFRTRKLNTAVAYTDIQEVELGAKSNPPDDAPLYKVWRLPKRVSPERVLRQMLTIEFTDKSGKAQTMTLEMEEPAAAATLEQIEIRQGKRHRSTNGDPWWGDNVWKTPRNNNSVNPEALGNSPAK
jgi:hypothetical protein